MLRTAAAMAATLLCAVVPTGARQDAPVAPLKRIVSQTLEVRRPFRHCYVADMAMRVAQIAGVPAGSESLPGLCGYEFRPDGEPEPPVNLRGLTVAEALDRLVALDPSYHWTETGGVVVIRPLDAWNNTDHFLNRSLASFRIDDEHMAGALNQIQAAINGTPARKGLAEAAMRTEQGNRRMSVSLGATTLYEAMNAIVRAHGSMWWQVRYCQPQASVDFSQVFLYTFDKSGLGAMGLAKRSDGTTYQPCMSASR